MLSGPRTVVAMSVAPLGTMAAHLVVSAAIGDLPSIRTSPVVTLIVGAVAGLVGLCLVLPVLLLIPRLRMLPWWAAATWAAALAVLVSLLFVGPSLLSRRGVSMAILGAASGLTYALAARALLYKQRAV